MHHHYERRRRPGRQVRIVRAVLVLAAIAALLAVAVVFLRWGNVERPVAEVDGVKQVSTVKDANLAVYDGQEWNAQFWNGVNVGPPCRVIPQASSPRPERTTYGGSDR